MKYCDVKEIFSNFIYPEEEKKLKMLILVRKSCTLCCTVRSHHECALIMFIYCWFFMLSVSLQKKVCIKGERTVKSPSRREN